MWTRDGRTRARLLLSPVRWSVAHWPPVSPPGQHPPPPSPTPPPIFAATLPAAAASTSAQQRRPCPQSPAAAGEQTSSRRHFPHRTAARDQQDASPSPPHTTGTLVGRRHTRRTPAGQLAGLRAPRLPSPAVSFFDARKLFDSLPRYENGLRRRVLFPQFHLRL